MKLALALAAVAALLCSSASTASAEEWTDADTAFEATFLTLMAVDYLQTRQIVACAQAGCGKEESNPIMGSRGERVPVDVYFASVGIAHVVAVRLLPQKYRPILHLASISLQAVAISSNVAAGYSLQF